MPITFTCDKCGKIMFDLLDKKQKETTTIAEIEYYLAIGCSDCILSQFIEEEEKEIDRIYIHDLEEPFF